MESSILSKTLSERMESLLCEFPPGKILKLLRVIYFDHLYRQHETGLRIGFDKEVQMMGALFELLEFAEEEIQEGKENSGQENSDFTLN